MRISEEIDYFKNELKSYTHLAEKVKELKIEQKKEISKKEEKIAQIKEEINNAWIKSPSFEQTSLSSRPNNDKVLQLIIKEEQLKQEIKETEVNYDFQIRSHLERIKFIENSLKKINENEKRIINDLYFKKIGYNEMCEKYSYSRQHLYRIVEKIIKKMIKK